MTPTEADLRYRTWMHDQLHRAATHFGLTIDGHAAFGWLDRTINAPARANGHPRWLRVVTEHPHWAQGDTWTGNLDANNLRDFPKPHVLDVHEWHDDPHRYVRAEVMTRLPGRPCSPTPTPPPGLTLPIDWWNSLTDLTGRLAHIPTRRINADQARVNERVRQVFGQATTVVIHRWETMHGDIHWNNLVADPFGLADWELWGRGPAGTDAATLYLYSLADHTTAETVHAHFSDILGSTHGRRAQLYVAARLLHRARTFGDTPELVRPLHGLAETLLTDQSVTG